MKKRPITEPKEMARENEKQRFPATPDPQKQEFGEGNYKASRDYDKAAAAFAKSGEVEQAAKDAAPRNAKEATELKQAEAEGLGKSKGEDPALHIKGFFPQGPKP